MQELFISVMGLMALAGFLSVSLRSSLGPDPSFRLWLSALLRAVVATVLLAYLSSIFFTILDRNVRTFYDVYNRQTQARWDRVRGDWGDALTQQELRVKSFIVRQVRKPLPGQPEHYQTVTEYESLSQNSITGFRGEVVLTLTDVQDGALAKDAYNTYRLSARYVYTVTNLFDSDIVAEFYFALPPGSILYDDFTLSLDGIDITRELEQVSSAFYWERPMTPGQQYQVSAGYAAQGMEGFYYQVPQQREIRDFSLRVSLNSQSFYVLNDPESEVLTPSRSVTDYTHLLWRLDRVLMSPRMGVSLVQRERPYAPYTKAYNLLSYGPYAALMLGVTVLLTCLIWGERVRLDFMALLLGGYGLQFYVLSALCGYFGLWGASWALGAFLSAVLLLLLFFRYTVSRPLRILFCVQGAVFSAYPLASLLVEMSHRDAVDIGLQAVLILYLFGLILYTRVREKHA